MDGLHEVDDLPINRCVIRKLLTKCGFSVIEASDGLQALDIFATERSEVAAVLLDLRMQGLDGWHTAQKLRQMEAEQDMLTGMDALDSAGTRRVPIICCTASALDERMCFNTACSAPCCAGSMHASMPFSTLSNKDDCDSDPPSLSASTRNDMAAGDDWSTLPPSPVLNNSMNMGTSGTSSSLPTMINPMHQPHSSEHPASDPSSLAQSATQPAQNSNNSLCICGEVQPTMRLAPLQRACCSCPHSWGHITVREAALLAGADDVCPKPFGMQQLQQLLDRNVPAWRSMVAGPDTQVSCSHLALPSHSITKTSR